MYKSGPFNLRMCMDVCIWNNSNTYVYVCVFMKQQVYLYVCVWICCVCVCVSCVVWSCNNQMIIMCLIVWQILVLLEINRQNDQKWMCCACMNVCVVFLYGCMNMGGDLSVWRCVNLWFLKQKVYVCVCCVFWFKKITKYKCVLWFLKEFCMNVCVACMCMNVLCCVLHVCVWMYCVVCCRNVYVVCVVNDKYFKKWKKIKLLLLVVLKQQQ